ncbi:TetR/AcrR family transcriptional regulator [Nocardia abscessus]|uniref:TetR/AcrR family transcriptional regulator n=1 Tax=Nocardia abscessus TaxID=120957 RepID=UPI00031709F1|nr:TetR/AcrR family transcriptional regulator [Nocardia abscessus]MCC3328290.1 TetR/AcrR family transcriptional regulator [Nocardia abscessus]
MTATSTHRTGIPQTVTPPPRAVRKQRARQRLLQAATDLLLTDGYTVTSIDQIAEHAGYARSGFFAHFDHLQQIGHDVADRLTRHAIRRIGCFQPRDRDQLVTTLTRWASILITKPGWIRLELDLAALDPASRAQVIWRLNQLRDEVNHLLTSSTDLPDPSIDLDHKISYLLSMIVGMATQHTGDLHASRAPSRDKIELVLRTAGIA